MKKIALLVLVAAFAASPAVAKHKKVKETESVAAKQSANTLRIFRDALPLALPSWALPIYFSMHKDDKKKK